MCFSFVESELLCALFFSHSVNLNRFGIFILKLYLYNKKSVLAFKNMFPPFIYL